MKKIKDLSLSMKLFIALIVISLIGIALRWDTVKKDISRSFGFFHSTEQTDSTSTTPPTPDTNN